MVTGVSSHSFSAGRLVDNVCNINVVCCVLIFTEGSMPCSQLEDCVLFSSAFLLMMSLVVRF